MFLTVCILFTTILLQGINVFSCPPTLLVRKQSKTNKKSTTSQTTERPKPSGRKGEGRGGEERTERMDYTEVIFVLFKWMGRDN